MRLKVLLIALLAASACAAPSPIAPSNGPWQFSGTISAMDGTQIGRPIVGAELTVVTGVNSNARVTTDVGGHYVFTGLESGRLTLAIAAPGYVKSSPIVDLYRDLDVHFVLKKQ